MGAFAHLLPAKALTAALEPYKVIIKVSRLQLGPNTGCLALNHI
jgi:hypothetical protein